MILHQGDDFSSVGGQVIDELIVGNFSGNGTLIIGFANSILLILTLPVRRAGRRWEDILVSASRQVESLYFSPGWRVVIKAPWNGVAFVTIKIMTGVCCVAPKGSWANVGMAAGDLSRCDIFFRANLRCSF